LYDHLKIGGGINVDIKAMDRLTLQRLNRSSEKRRDGGLRASRFCSPQSWNRVSIALECLKGERVPRADITNREKVHE